MYAPFEDLAVHERNYSNIKQKKQSCENQEQYATVGEDNKDKQVFIISL
jgi:hypothetical protein